MKRLASLAFALSLIAAPALAQTPRPAPLGARPAAPTLAQCNDPAARKTLVGGAEDQLTAVQEYMQAYGVYSESMAAWKSDQLIAKGAWTPAQAAAHAKANLEDPRFKAMSDANLKKVEALLAALKPFLEASESGDEMKTCTSLVAFIDAAYAVVDTTEKQWRYLDAQFEAVAREKGVSLD